MGPEEPEREGNPDPAVKIEALNEPRVVENQAPAFQKGPIGHAHLPQARMPDHRSAAGQRQRLICARSVLQDVHICSFGPFRPNPKGGCGKTTISTNLARALHDRGYSVLIVDSDPQGSARDWHAANEDNPAELVALDRPNSVKTLARIAANYDYVVIDGAAKLEDMVAACIKVSDFIIIPVQLSPYDIWAASDLVDFVKARQEVTDGVPLAGFVVSRAVEGTRLGADVRAALDEYALPVFAAAITQRQVYPQTASEGLTVFDADNAKARTEAVALTDEVLAMMAPTVAVLREAQ